MFESISFVLELASPASGACFTMAATLILHANGFGREPKI